MAFRTNPAPYQRSKVSTFQIMIILMIGLAIVWGCGIIYSFSIGSFNYTVNGSSKTMNPGIKAILNGIIAILVSCACDAVINVVKQYKKTKKVDPKETLHYVLHNYSYVTGLILALILPVYVSYYVLVIGCLFATLVCKSVFGGFGKNVFNPAAMARIFVGACFSENIGTSNTVAKALIKAATKAKVGTVDTISGATLTTAYNNVSNWLMTDYVGNAKIFTDQLFYGFNIKSLLLGQYLGTLGETFTIVILAVGIALSILKVINWRTPAFYLGTVAISALFIALFNGLNPGLYVLAHLSLGGLAFGAVFMLTDPVTGPTSNLGKIITAIFAGFMTVLIRVKGGYPEGVVYSIALANLISPFIDHVLKGKTNSHYKLKVASIGIGVYACAMILSLLTLGSATDVSKTTVGGLNYAENNTLVALYNPGGDNYYCKYSGEVKTDKVVSYTYSDKTSLDAIYTIKDENDNAIAYSYIVKDSYVISTGHSDDSYTSYAFIVIGTDGSLKAMNYFDGKGPSTGSTYYSDAVRITELFIGTNETTSQEVVSSDPVAEGLAADSISGRSYTPRFIKLFIQDAYDEYNAK